MNSLISMPFIRQTGIFAAAVLLAAGVASAQSSNSTDASTAPTYSSSQTGLDQVQLAELNAPAMGARSAASPGGGAAGQYGSHGGGQGYHAMFHHWTFEVGAGFNAPTGEDTHANGVVAGGPIPVITWGGNFTAGGGLRFNRFLSVLGEYQFIGDKLPGAFISAVSNACEQDTNCATQVTTGNARINSITASPVVDLTPKKSSGIYVVGGAGWYHKSTNFNAPGFCSYYYGCSTVTISTFSSNQWGANGGLGLYHRFSNVYGDTNHNEVFAEARYLYIHTPPATQSNGVGITELIPVTVGFRF